MLSSTYGSCQVTRTNKQSSLGTHKYKLNKSPINVTILQNIMRNTAQVLYECIASAASNCGLRETKGNGMHIVIMSSNAYATFPKVCLLLLLYLSSTLAAPHSSCILCDKEDLTVKNPMISDSYEEFTFDHQVSRQDAIQALRKYNESQNACNSMECTSVVLNYCLSQKFLNDHCWCELQHREEGLPYVPHICYSTEKEYKPSVGSCFFFEEVKECCCASALVKEWRHISAASFTKPNAMLGSLLLLLGLLHWRSRRH